MAGRASRRAAGSAQNVAAGLRAPTGVQFGHAEGWFDPIAGQGCRSAPSSAEVDAVRDYRLAASSGHQAQFIL